MANRGAWSRIAAAIAGLLFACVARAFPSGPYFPLPDGATWTYSSTITGTVTESVIGSVVFNGNTVRLVRDNFGNDAYYTNDSQGVRLHGRFFPDPAGNETDTYSPPVPMAAVDAAIGSAVNGAGFVYASIGFENYAVAYSSTSTPVALESVTVPAGTFANALRLQTTISFQFGDLSWYQSVQTWLVVGIGSVKQVLFDSFDGSTETRELVSASVPDIVPNQFSFPPKTVPPFAFTVSDPITVTGIGAPAPIIVAGGEYSVNGGPATSVPGTVNNNDQVAVSVTAPSPGESTTVTLTIGGVRADFVVTSIADTTPNPFGTIAAQGVPPGVAIASNIIIVSGTDAAVPISVSGGEYSIENLPYTSAPGSVGPGSYVRVRVMSSTTPGATVAATVTIGGVSGSFSATTMLPTHGPRTVLYFDSQPGETIGRGDRRIYDVPEAPLPGVTTTLTATREWDNSVRFTMNQSMAGSHPESATLNLAAPGGGAPLPGRYEGALRYPFNGGAPGLSFSKEFGCNALNGRFDVLEAVFAQNGEVVRFAANFEQTCQFESASLSGQIRYNSGIPLGSSAIIGRRADLSGDGRSDVLWRNAVTGENYLYPMNAAAILPGEGYVRTVPDLNWNIVGTGDFNGDGKADILWRNSVTGENYVYLMSGTAIIGEGYLRTVAEQSWQVAGIGDFNSDGRADILWRNAASGENYLYIMNGLAIANEGYLRTVANLAWSIRGVSDFDGDGKADILWRNAASGENYAYLMDGLLISGEGYLRTVASAQWQISGVGDFNGDGRGDVLWRNSASGENYVYLMNGVAIIDEGYLRTVPDQNWQVAALGDYDGDGKTDVLWRNSASGENYLYPLDGIAIKGTEGYLRTVAQPDWQIVAK